MINATRRLRNVGGFLVVGIEGMLLLLVVGCGGGETEEPDRTSRFAFEMGPPLTDSTYAIVVASEYGGDTLRASDYNRMAQELRWNRSRGRRPRQVNTQRDTVPTDSTALHRRVVNQFVTRHVMLEQAKANKVEVDSARLAREMERIRNRYEREATLQAELREHGLSLDSLRARKTNTLRMQRLAQQWTSEVNPPSASEIQEYRQDPQNRRVRVRHILLRVEKNTSPDTVDSTRAQAQSILDSIRGGESFAEMARRHSEAATASMGGMMQPTTPRQMPQPVADAVRALKDVGAVSDEPVHTDKGFHLFQLVDQQAPTRGKAKWKLFSRRRSRVMQEKRRSLLAEAEVRVHPEIVEVDVEEN